MTENELDHALLFATDVASTAGSLLEEHLSTDFSVSKKGRINLVTEMDLRSEQLITDRIKSTYPEHSVLAEEGGRHGHSTDRPLWIIDPLDGTTNYAHGYPFFCVSVALEVAGVVEMGVVFDPMRNEMFSARRGAGASRNGERIQVSLEQQLSESMVCTGFSYDEEAVRSNLELFNQVILEARAVRRDGAAALDLCYVACGRFDGFWELSLNSWDVAAGQLILTEAGGKISRFDGTAVTIYDLELLATNGRIHDQLSRVLV